MVALELRVCDAVIKSIHGGCCLVLCSLGATPETAFLYFNAGVFPWIIFCGFIISGDAVPVYFRWIEWSSPMKYIFSLMNIHQWDGFGPLGGCDDSPLSTAASNASSVSALNGRGCQFRDGQAVLAYWNIKPADDIKFLLILLGHMVLCRALAFVALRKRLRKGLAAGLGTKAP
jgi:hypothetical protein